MSETKYVKYVRNLEIGNITAQGDAIGGEPVPYSELPETKELVARLAEREAQAVQREREAARELIKELREAIEDCLENTAERAALGYDAETTIDEEDGTVCYPWGNSHNVRLQAAIQKAKEAKV
jgi:ABC-type nitrate/sulfonate/bicarbonate transport system substrate-binding protein